MKSTFKMKLNDVMKPSTFREAAKHTGSSPPSSSVTFLSSLRFDMEDGAIQEELQPFLQAHTEHFLHEFISFARAPFDMEAYDQHAIYDCPAPSSDDDDDDGDDTTDSSVIAISEDGDGEEGGGGSLELDSPADSASSEALSQTAWDDETRGPSYSTAAEAGRAPPLDVLDDEHLHMFRNIY